MGKSLGRAIDPLSYAQQQSTLYPLQGKFLALGLSTAFAFGIYLLSPLVAVSFVVLFGAVGALWRRGEPPVLAFCVAYQWLFVVTGYLYKEVTGRYPGLPTIGDLEGAVLLSLVGLTVLVVGIRVGLLPFSRHFSSTESNDRSSESERYDVRRLFWYVIILYTANWLFEVAPMAIWFNAAQIIGKALASRAVLLFLLLLVILRQREGYRYGVAALIFVLIPELTTMWSSFKDVLFVLLIALLAEWRPWSQSIDHQRRNSRILLTAVGTVTVVLVMLLIWQGGVKGTWRFQLRTGAVPGSPIDRVGAFVSLADEVVSDLQWDRAWETMASRIASSMGYFSHVLWRVPSLMPHEDGRLISRALKHVFMPRVLFPNKPNLGGDSWLVWQYAGIPVAGASQGTSVGLGYMPEFYIDFGVPGMFGPIFLYGLIVGLFYRVLRTFSPSPSFYHSAVAIVFLENFLSFEGEIAKLLGGLVMAFVVFNAIFFFAGSWLHRNLLLDREPNTEKGALSIS